MLLTNTLQFGIRRLTDAMQQMTSVERIVQYAEIESVIRFRFSVEINILIIIFTIGAESNYGATVGLA